MKWSEENVIAILKHAQIRYGIEGCFDTDKFCSELGVDDDGLVYLLSYMLIAVVNKLGSMQASVEQLGNENQRLNCLLKSTCNDNGRAVQMAKVMSGLPIARKPKKNLVELELQIMFGLTDKELMEYFEISKTTLWRWKKELEEKKKSGRDWFVKQKQKNDMCEYGSGD